MKDKNDKELCKGDIVKWTKKAWGMSATPNAPIVSWLGDEEIEIVVIENIVPSFKAYYPIGAVERRSTIEVIGNKFDNPELLELI